MFKKFFSEDISKFLILFCICSLVLFNLTISKNLGSIFILNKIGVEFLPKIKILFILPISILVTLFQMELFNKYNSRNVFIFLLTIFGLFFGFYGIFMNIMKKKIFHYVFYILLEFWGFLVFETSMWIFFIDVCSLNQAKKFFVLISGAEIGSIIAVSTSLWLPHIWKSTGIVRNLIYLMTFTCFILIIIVKLTKNKLKFENKKQIQESNIGFFQSIKGIFKSKYMVLILITTICYNMSMIAVDYIWKFDIKKNTNFDDKKLFLFNNKYLFFSHLASIFISIFISPFVERLGSIILPIIILPLNFIIFTTFYFIFMRNPYGGAMQTVFVKTTKHTIAAPARNILFTLTNALQRHQIRVTIDIFGVKLSKALMSLYNILILGPADFPNMIYLSYPVLIPIGIIWIISSIALGKMFDNKRSINE